MPEGSALRLAFAFLEIVNNFDNKKEKLLSSLLFIVDRLMI